MEYPDYTGDPPTYDENRDIQLDSGMAKACDRCDWLIDPYGPDLCESCRDEMYPPTDNQLREHAANEAVLFQHN